MPSDARGAIARFQNSAEHSDQRSFSGAIRSEKTEDGAFSDFQRNVVDRGEITEAFRQPFALDHRFRHTKIN